MHCFIPRESKEAFQWLTENIDLQMISYDNVTVVCLIASANLFRQKVFWLQRINLS